ncbi:rub [Linum grandiflorum]
MAASAATTRPTFSFHLISQQLVSSHSLPRTRFHFSIPQPSISLCNPQRTTHFALSSIDVSKEDKPPTPDAQISEPVALQDEESSELESEQQFDKRRLEEKFAVLNTGVYECRSCGYKYDEAVGDASYPVPPGLPFDKLPEDWRCPTCGAAQSFFQSKSVEIAGFAQNQQYGLGGNTLTSGQKAVLIYGSLLLFFALFLSGYFLQ